MNLLCRSSIMVKFSKFGNTPASPAGPMQMEPTPLKKAKGTDGGAIAVGCQQTEGKIVPPK